jgi:hypothetical protein
MDGTGGESETTFCKSDKKSCKEFLPISQQTRLWASLITTITSQIRFVRLARVLWNEQSNKLVVGSKFLGPGGMSKMCRKSWLIE